VQVGELCDVLDHKRKPITKRDRVAGEHPYYGATGVLDYVDGYLFDEKLVLVGEDGAKWGSGENTAFGVEGKCWINNHAHVLRPYRDKVADGWLIYFLNHSDLAAFVSGLTVSKLNQGSLRDIPIPVPQIAEQRRIVGLLDKAFGGIATAKANAEKNLQNARDLLESHLQAVFAQRREGWIAQPLGEVCGFVRGPFGGSLKKSIFAPHGYAVYEQQHAIYSRFDDVRYFVGEAKFKEMKRFELYPNDLIMSCSGTMGRVAIVPNSIKRGIINQALLKLTPTAKISSTFLKFWMESEAFQGSLKEYSGGAAIQNVASVRILKEIRIPLPSMAEQGRVVQSIESISAETQRLASIYQQKLAALDELKKSLLHQAFTGQL
jgi:type I restriction enzyme S subunit